MPQEYTWSQRTTCESVLVYHVGLRHQIQATGLGGKGLLPIKLPHGSFLFFSETGFHYVAQVGLRLVIILSQPIPISKLGPQRCTST